MTRKYLGSGALIPAAAALLLLGGCASQPWRFVAVGDGGEAGAEARVLLESERGREGSIRIEALGRSGSEVDGVATDVVTLRFAVDNGSSDDLLLLLTGVRLHDDAGRTWRFFGVRGVEAPEGEAGDLNVPAETRRTVELLFDAGAPSTLRTTGSVTALWSYQFRGQTYSHQHRFLPGRHARRVYYHDPYPVFFHGAYYRGRYGYPYYGPYRGTRIGVGAAWTW